MRLWRAQSIRPRWAHQIGVAPPPDQLPLGVFQAWQDLVARATGHRIPAGMYLAEQRTKGAAHYLVSHEERLVGSAQVCRDRFGRLHIHRVVVDEARRGQGMAFALFETVFFNHHGEPIYATIDGPEPAPAVQKLFDLFGFIEEDADDERQETEETDGGDQGPAGEDHPAGGEL